MVTSPSFEFITQPVNINFIRMSTFDCSMCDANFTLRDHMLRHVRQEHRGVWTCSRCNKSYDRENNFRYHVRTCDWKATGVKRSAEFAEQFGGSKRARRGEVRAPIADDPIIKSIDLTSKSQVDNDAIYKALSASIYEMKERLVQELTANGTVQFYTTLHVRFTSSPFVSTSPIILSSEPATTTSSADLTMLLDRTYDNFADQLEVYERRGWRIEQLVLLNLYFPQQNLS